MTKLMIHEGDRVVHSYSEDIKKIKNPITGEKVKHHDISECFFHCDHCGTSFKGIESTKTHFNNVDETFKCPHK